MADAQPDMPEQDLFDERAELHFLAALVDELMRALHAKGAREELQQIEDNAKAHTGGALRAW